MPVQRRCAFWGFLGGGLVKSGLVWSALALRLPVLAEANVGARCKTADQNVDVNDNDDDDDDDDDDVDEDEADEDDDDDEEDDDDDDDTLGNDQSYLETKIPA